MFFRIARYYLRMEWIKVAAAVFAILLYAVLMVNDSRSAPMTYDAFVTQYCSTNKYSYSSGYMLDYLADHYKIPREELGESFADAYPVFYWRHFDRFVGYTCGFTAYFAPVLAGAAAVLFLCAIFRKRRLGPLLAAGCRRGAVYLFLTTLYFAFFLLLWLVAVPFLLSRYRFIPLTDEQVACLKLIKTSVLLSLLFGAAAGYFFAFLLRRPFPAFAAVIALWFLILGLSGQRFPVPVEWITSLLEWKADTPAGPLVAQVCITAVTVVAAVIGGWSCFRRREQD
ncbi:MAG: hypothetical protein J5633_07430 [Oscillospiraceae bacterium]|nr:hypothetical protein [Oscillospiraceae bacterium]